MKHLLVSVAALVLLTATPAFAADPWPWKSKMPPNPALTELSEVVEVTATVKDDIVTISVKAKAPQGGYSELQLTPRMGDPKDRVFGFDAEGRPPQMGTDVMTPVSIEVSYSVAPIGKFDVIEVYGKTNCVGYSLKDNKAVECTAQSMPQ